MLCASATFFPFIVLENIPLNDVPQVMDIISRETFVFPQLLVIIEEASMNICIQIFAQVYILFSWTNIKRQDFWIVCSVCFYIWKTNGKMLFSKMPFTFCLAISNLRQFSNSVPLPALDAAGLCDSRSNKPVVVFHCGLSLHLPND